MRNELTNSKVVYPRRRERARALCGGWRSVALVGGEDRGLFAALKGRNLEYGLFGSSSAAAAFYSTVTVTTGTMPNRAMDPTALQTVTVFGSFTDLPVVAICGFHGRNETKPSSYSTSPSTVSPPRFIVVPRCSAQNRDTG